jgi:hypothetical protein
MIDSSQLSQAPVGTGEQDSTQAKPACQGVLTHNFANLPSLNPQRDFEPFACAEVFRFFGYSAIRRASTDATIDLRAV